MTTQVITTRNYRTYLLNKAAKTGDRALANLAKTATAETLRNLYVSAYMLTKVSLKCAVLIDHYQNAYLLTRQEDGTVTDETGAVYIIGKHPHVSSHDVLITTEQQEPIMNWVDMHPYVQALFKIAK